VGIIAFAVAHLFAGVLIGTRFRFAALLPAFAVVAIESLIGDFYFGFSAWYIVLAVGVVAVQAGYAGGSRLRPAGTTEASGLRPVRTSPPK
jgi:hypothetical protein